MISSPFIRLAGVSDTLHAPYWVFHCTSDPPRVSWEGNSPSDQIANARRQLLDHRYRDPPASWRVVQSRSTHFAAARFNLDGSEIEIAIFLRQGKRRRLFLLNLRLTVKWRRSASRVCWWSDPRRVRASQFGCGMPLASRVALGDPFPLKKRYSFSANAQSSR